MKLKPTHLFTWLIVPLLAMALLTSTGCTDAQIENYQAARAELVAALDLTKAQLAEARAQVAELTAQIEATPDGPDKDAALATRDQIAGVIGKGEALVPQLEQGIAQATAAIDAAMAGNAADAVRIVGTYAGTKAPPPWNVYILLGTTALGGVLAYIQKRKKEEAEAESKKKSEEIVYTHERVRSLAKQADQTRAAAASVITAIEYEKGDNDTVDFSDNGTKISLRSRMSTEARELVEQVRRDVPKTLKAVTAA